MMQTECRCCCTYHRLIGFLGHRGNSLTVVVVAIDGSIGGLTSSLQGKDRSHSESEIKDVHLGLRGLVLSE